MNDRKNKRKDKLKELIAITSISEEKLEKLNFKEKQQYYKAKNKLCVKFWDGKAGTYRKESTK